MSGELRLHDIRPLADVPDGSFYIFLLITTIAALLIALLALFFYRLIKSRRGKNMRKEYYEKLKQVDFSNSKEAAYSITHYGAYFLNSDTNNEPYYTLVERLEVYKYRKDVPSIDEETKGYFENFINSLQIGE